MLILKEKEKYNGYSYKGSISFGLVYIPIMLHNTIKDNSIGFNMIDKKTMSRVKYKKTCSACDGREVKQEDIVKGYEYEEGKYVIFCVRGKVLFWRIYENRNVCIVVLRMEIFICKFL